MIDALYFLIIPIVRRGLELRSLCLWFFLKLNKIFTEQAIFNCHMALCLSIIKVILNDTILLWKGDKDMAKPKMTPKNNAANMKNPNKGTNGVNRQYSQVHGNRGKQMMHNTKKK